VFSSKKQILSSAPNSALSSLKISPFFAFKICSSFSLVQSASMLASALRAAQSIGTWFFVAHLYSPSFEILPLKKVKICPNMPKTASSFEAQIKLAISLPFLTFCSTKISRNLASFGSKM